MTSEKEPVRPDPKKCEDVTVSSAKKPAIPDYELIHPIGHGSYGDVWLARGLTGVYRAIKVIWRERFADAEPFEREFKGLKKFTAMSLFESGQLALLHVGQSEGDGFFYYVMELADDVDTGREVNPAQYLPLTLREVRARRGRLPADECVAIGIELARALAGLHSRGLVHRDIKLSNVIIVGGVPKLADIGLVASTADARTYVGTEGYVPPEGPGKPSADVFALGKLLYELATGLDREEFPRLPDELAKLPDRTVLLELNEVILRSCDPESRRRYPDAAALLKNLLELQAGQLLRLHRSRSRTWRIGVALMVVIAATGTTWWWKTHPVAPMAESGPLIPASKSIAVLPFENMSEDKGNAFFADGIHEDVLTNLALIRDIRVVSRTSVMQYRGTTKTIKQIGQELGVAYVLEGSVRREGNSVRVTGQLIDARTDEHIWGKVYDRELNGIFTIQGELAEAIAGALQSVLSPATKALIVRRPTENAAAYDAFLKARQIRYSTDKFKQNGPDEILLLEEAVRLDPDFAAAWAELASRRARAYFFFSPGAAQLGPAKEAIDAAVRLAPDDPAVIEGLGDYYYYGYRDYIRATEQYLRLAQMRPNDPTVYLSLGLIQRRQGRWADAIANFRRALKLDPTNALNISFLILDLTNVRHYEEAETMMRRYIREHPQDLIMESQLVWVTFDARGSTEEMQAIARRTVNRSEHSLHLAIQMGFARMRGDWSEAARIDREQRYWDGNPGNKRWNQNVNAAESFAESGDMITARTRATEAMTLMYSELKQQPENSSLWAAMALANAILGNKDETLRCVQKSSELLPESRDADIGRANAITCTFALAWIGERDQALAEIERLLHVPDGLNIYQARTHFRPLHDDPRFKALVSDLRNNDPLL